MTKTKKQDNILISPVFVCTSDQIEELRNDSNFKELPKGKGTFSIFRLNKNNG